MMVDEVLFTNDGSTMMRVCVAQTGTSWGGGVRHIHARVLLAASKYTLNAGQGGGGID